MSLTVFRCTAYFSLWFRLVSISFIFIIVTMCIYIMRVCVWVNICVCVFVRPGIIRVVHWFNKNGWNDIQSSDIKHQRPRELWCIDRLREQRQRWLRGWKSWKKEIDEADRRQAARGLQQILFGVWASEVYVSQDLKEKLLPWETE